MDRVPAASLIAVLLAVAGGLQATAAESTGGSREPAFGALVDSVPGPRGRGETYNVESRDGRPLSRIRVRWAHGVRSRLGDAGRPRTFARLFTSTADGARRKAVLKIPARDHRGHIDLLDSGSADVTATLTAGRRPTVAVSGLPAGTVLADLVTARAGVNVLRSSGCFDERRRERGSVAISFADGSPTFRKRFRVISVC